MKALALAAVADALERGERLGPAAAAELAEAIRQALAGRSRLDEALGLRGGPGERSAATRMMIARRDAALREAAARFWPDAPAAQQAEELATRWARYASSAWRRDAGEATCPARHEGTVYAALWAAMRAGARPLSAERIRRLLVTSSGYS